MQENGNNVVEETIVQESTSIENETKKKSKKGIVLLLIGIILILGILVFCILTLLNPKDKGTSDKEVITNETKKSEYYIENNEISDFDLSFLKLENEPKNKLYSPLSIKYALEMLSQGAKGETKEQITNILGKYQNKNYTNSNNLSFANALFVSDKYKDKIKSTYTNKLSVDYGAEVIYDSFQTPNTINDWISNKTFKLINNMVSDVSQTNFVLVNALAIDMEWNKTIKPKENDYWVSFKYEKFNTGVNSLTGSWYPKLNFNNGSSQVMSADISAVANRYDIVGTLGKETIKEKIKTAYQKWLDEGSQSACYKSDNTKDIEESGQAYVDKNLDTYISEFEKNKNHVSSSTDFYFYTDDDTKVFAKDLKTYDGTTLQYVGIMPTNVRLENYVSSIKADDVNKLIKSLKTIDLNSFKEGVITEIKGNIPLFKYDYELKLNDDLKKLGVTNIYDSNKVDLSNITDEKVIIDAAHKADIEFSNEGIKAAASTAMLGKGAGECGFYYSFEVPVETIDLTFDKPYMYIIRDKESNEVWFVGTVYNPTEYAPYTEN